MNVKKLLSATSSAAVALSMISSSGGLVFLNSVTAEAAGENPLSISMSADKTTFTMDEISAGAKTTVYVDAAASVSESDYVKSLEFALVSDSWGKVDPVNLRLSEPNKLKTKKYDSPERGAYSADGSIVASLWNKRKLSDAGYSIIDYKSIAGFGGYSMDNLPKVILMSDSDHGFLRTEGSGDHIAEFDLEFPTDLAAGTYSINLMGAKSIICADGDLLSATAKLVDAPSAQGITFTIGDGGPAPAETTPAPVATTPAPVQTTPAPAATTPAPSGDKTYVGSAELIGANVTGNPGDEVYVPVYIKPGADTTPTLEGLAFKLKFDESMLELDDVVKPKFAEPPYDAGFDGASMTASIDTRIVLFKMDDNITPFDVYPENPICVLKFIVKDGASGVIPINFVNNLDESKPVEIVKETLPQQPVHYLTPTVTAGSIAVGGATPPATTPAPSNPGGDTTTVASKVYVGSANLVGEQNVAGKPGETVNVPVYFNMNADDGSKTLEGLAFKVKFDESMLELDDIVKPKFVDMDPGFDGASMSASPETKIVLFKMDDNITPFDVIEGNPICVLQFIVKDSASGVIPIQFVNNLDESKPVEVVKGTVPQQPVNYLMPTVTDGSIAVGGSNVPATTPAATTPAPGGDNTTVASKIYVGSANLVGEQNVAGKPGETVNVPVYFNMNADDGSKTLEGLAFKVKFDESMLELEDIAKPKFVDMDPGFDGASMSASPETKIVLFKMDDNITPFDVIEGNPICVLQFKVKDGATGVIPISFVNNLDESKPVEVVKETLPQQPVHFLMPSVTDGSIVVSGTAPVDTTPAPVQTTPAPVDTTPAPVDTTPAPVDTTPAPVDTTPAPVDTTPAPTTGTPGGQVTVASKVYVGSAELYGEQNVAGKSGELVNVPVYFKMNADDGTKTLEGLAFKLKFDESMLELEEVLKPKNAEPPYPAGFDGASMSSSTDTKIVLFKMDDNITPFDVIEGNPICVLQFRVKDGASGIIPISFVNNLDESKPVEIVKETLPQQPVHFLQPTVTNGSVVIEGTTPGTTPGGTVTTPGGNVTTPGGNVTTGGGDATTTPSVTTPGGTATSISFKIIDKAVNGSNMHWYYADHSKWNTDGIEVYVNGTKVNNPALTFTVGGKAAATPEAAYDKSTFNYTVEVAYEGAKTTFAAKIGQRGDANCDHQVNARDAAAIARDLAQIFKTGKTTLTAEDGFGIFLANSDEGMSDKSEVYKPYDFAVRDAATLAKYLSRLFKEPNLTLYDVAVLKK